MNSASSALQMRRTFLSVGYELSERQARAHFLTFGVLIDLYLPKLANALLMR